MRLTVVAALAVLAVAGCHKPADAPATAPSSAASPAAASGLTISDGRLVLPAVKGNPGAAYFTLANDSHGTVAITGIAVAGAPRSEIHQTRGGTMTAVDRAETEPGTRLSFAPGGLHVMVFDLKPLPKIGSSVTMTLHLADGQVLTAPLKVEAPGGGDGMEGMH